MNRDKQQEGLRWLAERLWFESYLDALRNRSDENDRSATA